MTAATTTPRVWIGCLASYNAGRLIGEWCEATDVDVMNDTWEDVKVQAIAAARAAGEYPVYFGEPEEPFLADNEGFGFQVGEYPDWSALAKVGALIEERGEDFVAFLSWIDEDPLEVADELEERFNEAYCGSAEDEKSYAYQYVEEVGWAGVEGQELRDSQVYNYLDWDLIVQELFRHGPYSLVDGVVLRGE
jgi:antirestriction protein